MATAVGDIFSLRVTGLCNDQTYINQHWYRIDTINPNITEQATAIALIDAVRGGVGGSDFWESTFLACMPQDFNLVNYVSQRVYPQRMAYQVVGRNVPGTGGIIGETLQNVSWVLTKYTPYGGRDAVGSVHGIVPDGEYQDGDLKPTLIQAVNQFGAAYLGGLAVAAIGLSAKPIIWHKDSNGNAVVKQVTSTECQQEVRVMRRRNKRLGI